MYECECAVCAFCISLPLHNCIVEVKLSNLNEFNSNACIIPISIQRRLEKRIHKQRNIWWHSVDKNGSKRVAQKKWSFSLYLTILLALFNINLDDWLFLCDSLFKLHWIFNILTQQIAWYRQEFLNSFDF